MRTTIFVCDTCGDRKKLDRTKEHWCKSCAGKKETEMHPVSTKPLVDLTPVRRGF